MMPAGCAEISAAGRTAILGGVTPADVLTERLVAALAAGPPVRLAMLFGSAARGTMHAGSDVDIGFIPVDPDLPLGDELDLQLALSAACGREVDLVRLDHAQTLLKWQVAREGRVLVAGGPFETSRFVATAAAEWLDFEPGYTRAAERFRQRLAARRPGGAAE
jgi:predicted nucleotidyltransferase